MISHWLLLGSYANFVSLVSFMNDPIFAAPRRQEGFASEKQKLLEDCRRRLSKMATFSKGERDVFVATKTTAGNKSMTSNQSSWHKWKLGRIVWLWHIQFAGLFVGTCISRKYLENLWEVVKTWNFSIPWNYQKVVGSTSFHWTALVDVRQAPRCPSANERAKLSWSNLTFVSVSQGTVGWMDLKILPAWISYLKLSAHPDLIHYVAIKCRPYGGDVWRWSQRKKEVRKKLCNIDSRSNSRSMNWAPGCAAMIRVPVSLGGTAEPRMMWFIYGRCKGACFSNRMWPAWILWSRGHSPDKKDRGKSEVVSIS